MAADGAEGRKKRAGRPNAILYSHTAVVLMVRLLVFSCGVSDHSLVHSLGARLNTASDTPPHCPRRTKARQTHLCLFGLRAKKQDFFMWRKVYWLFIQKDLEKLQRKREIDITWFWSHETGFPW